MTTADLSLRNENRGKIRPINSGRDMPKIADLVELCFRNNMDSEGKRYIEQVRSMYKKQARRTQQSLPLAGYIWDIDGKIVGNISIFAFRQRNYLLANIAVHPQYRRRGIARALTEHSMTKLRRRGAKAIWLHVENDNFPAIQLYQSIGFQQKALRANWQGGQLLPPQINPENYRITTKIGTFSEQEDWLSQSYPENIRWYRTINFQIFSSGLQYWLYRLFVEKDIRQWTLLKNGERKAALFWHPTHTKQTPLWLAAAPQMDAEPLAALLLHARRQLSRHKTELYLDYPAWQHRDAFLRAGFKLHRTLIWMQAPGQG